MQENTDIVENNRNFRFIDLFCGIGGFHSALSSIGGECVFACDLDRRCRDVYRGAFGLEPAADIRRVAAMDVPDHDLLCAGFPCQSFSKAGLRKGFADATRGTLFFEVLRILAEKRPAMALLENVRNLASHDSGRTWSVIRDSLRGIGYSVPDVPTLLSPHQLGIPQLRERVFIPCLRSDLGGPVAVFVPHEPPVTDCSSVLQSDSDAVESGSEILSKDLQDLVSAWGEFVRGCDSGVPPPFPVWAEFLRPVSEISGFSSMPGWKRSIASRCSDLYSRNQPFVSDWQSRASSLPAFFGAKARLEWQAGTDSAEDIWDHVLRFRPSGLRVSRKSRFPALVAIGQVPIVGWKRRFLSPRECARLQGLPDSMPLDPNPNAAYRQLGNAVNSDCVRLVAEALLEASGRPL